MILKELQDLIMKNDIQDNVTLLSDSGWEADATDIYGVYYSKECNVLIFTQGYSRTDFEPKERDEYIKIDINIYNEKYKVKDFVCLSY